MKKRSGLKTVLVMLLLTAAILAGYYVINNKTNNEKAETESVETEKDKLLEKDLATSYPATPREVVKLYSRILKCLYSDQLTDEEVTALSKQVRCLYDEELLSNNEETENIDGLNAERTDYSNQSKTITSYVLEKSDDVIFWTDEGREYASIIACFTLKEDVQYTRTYEKFLLRKDDNGNWKIVGWGLADEGDMEQ